MTNPRLPYSARKFLRKEKARMRRETLGATDAEKKIQDLTIHMREQFSRKKSRV